jgi:hypothetical protein
MAEEDESVLNLNQYENDAVSCLRVKFFQTCTKYYRIGNLTLDGPALRSSSSCLIFD